ncbi:MAG: dTMP kinase [Ilumatobacter sp.]|nr:dTMP kinase [Ilumatobacter sp.]MDG2438894.1 dTMP kinase [Ilumatobacter sp.]
MTAPRYIAFEGAEACGKSTQAALLADRLGAVLTRETGGTAVGARLRAILHDNAVTNLSARAEALMTAADRAQHIVEVVTPALEAGQNVVSDRSLYSTLAYQGFGRQLPVEELKQINDWATAGRWPQLVVFLDTPEEMITERLRKRDLDRFETAGEAFHQRVIQGFRTMAGLEPERWITIDGHGTIGEVEDTIVTALTERGLL